MMAIDELYEKSVAENKRNLKLCEDYLDSLKSLDLNVYAERLKVPVLVPLGNKILFRGEIRHTNEVTVFLGADYFAKCSVAQAEVLKQYKIKEAQSKVNIYRKEKEYLEKQISFMKENVLAKDAQEILEEYSEEDDKAWREKHRHNVKKYKQSQAKENIKLKDAASDAELWERLEELELQEELENELLDNYNEIVDKRKKNTFLQKEEALLRNSFKEENNDQNTVDVKENHQLESVDNKINVKEESNLRSNANEETIKKIVQNEFTRHEMLQKVLDKQNELENKLHELKHREKQQSKTEQELLARLDEMEQLDEIEDELERLDDILETEDVDTEDVETEDSIEDEDKSESITLKKSISFADENNSETSEITFSHTDTEPNREPFNPEQGISKPSDLYEAYPHLFDNKTISILKKSKYGHEEEKSKEQSVKQAKQVMFKETSDTLESAEPEETSVDRKIIIKDVVENVGVNQHKIEGGARPTSLFKKRRMQNNK